jgi:hypothetical protein
MYICVYMHIYGCIHANVYIFMSIHEHIYLPIFILLHMNMCYYILCTNHLEIIIGTNEFFEKNKYQKNIK